ncbi:MAG: YcjF family protein [Coriobacteriia bacterium]
MALPLDIRDLVKSGARLQQDRDQPVRIAVLVEVDAADVLVDGLRERFRPRTAGATLQLEVISGGSMPVIGMGTDAVIAVAGSGMAGLREALVAPRQGRLPLAVVALAPSAESPRYADVLQQPTADLFVGDDVADVLDERLAGWLADELGPKRLALAHNFAFMRRAVADEAVQTTAWQNAVVGAVAIIPGADMPVMTANQAKMLLQIAAAYGEKLGPDRIKELAAVVGTGFVFRTVARQALTFVPVLGWAVKGGFGYAGTVAMGKAAIAYFEQGADLTSVARKLKDGAIEVAGRVQIPEKVKAAARLRGRKQQALPAAGVVIAEVQPTLPGMTSGAAETAGE